MILIAGGTGNLGTQVARLLSARGLDVRVLTRDSARARNLEGDFVEVIPGDVLDPRAVERAVAGASTVISAIHGFAGTGDSNPQTVDRQGNSNLIQAAQRGTVEHFILVSIQGTTPDHPMELFRMKYVAEQELRASRLAWTIIRPTAYMETWAALLGEPLLRTGKTRIFGKGDNPINFVSVYDVARFVELAVVDPAMRGELVEVGGPENLSMEQVVQTFEAVTGKGGTKSHVPLPMMRLMSVLMRPVNPTLARQIQAGVVMDTRDMSFDPSETMRRYPSIPLTRLAEVVRRDYTA
jgi:uncharacterized protein YbjT (DUF2867 family)